MAAAYHLAQREGVGGLTMRRLGEELGVDVTALYRLFRDKDELLLAVYDRATSIEIDEIGPEPVAGHPAPDRRCDVADRVAVAGDLRTDLRADHRRAR